MAIASHEPTSAELEQAMELRRRVFCDEQGVDPVAEFDGLDEDCQHLVTTSNGRVVGTCRLREIEPGVLKLERMAVDADSRRAGVGRSLSNAADALARRLGAKRIVLHAQRRAEPFYASCGYAAQGDTFLEEGIPHVQMTHHLHQGVRPLTNS